MMACAVMVRCQADFAALRGLPLATHERLRVYHRGHVSPIQFAHHPANCAISPSVHNVSQCIVGAQHAAPDQTD